MTKQYKLNRQLGILIIWYRLVISTPYIQYIHTVYISAYIKSISRINLTSLNITVRSVYFSDLLVYQIRI